MNWYVASTIVGREPQAERQLSRFETFLPLTRIPRTVYRRTDQLKRALFPDYFFVRCDPRNRPLRRNDFRGLVGLGGPGIGEPLVVEVGAIAELMGVVDAQRIFRYPELEPGSLVEIVGQNTFWGRQGLYECSRGDERVIVLLNAVVPFRVEVPRSEVRPT